MKKLALRLVSFAAPLALTATAFAQDAPMTDAEATAIAGRALAAGLAIGIAAFGCGTQPSRASLVTRTLRVRSSSR
jgi:hypothetical protein